MDQPHPDGDVPRPAGRVEHRMERSYELAATPEQVWEVVATAEGITSWMAPTQLDPRVGGPVSFDFGDVVSLGVVTGFTPEERFAYEEPWPIAEAPDDLDLGMAEWFATIGVPLTAVYESLPLLSPIATEFLISGSSGARCVLRVVTSAYGTGAGWETEFFDRMITDFAALLGTLAARFSPADPSGDGPAGSAA